MTEEEFIQEEERMQRIAEEAAKRALEEAELSRQIELLLEIRGDSTRA